MTDQKQTDKLECRALLAWIDSEIEYHKERMDSINPDAGEREEVEYTSHNIAYMRFTHIRGMFERSKTIFYYSAITEYLLNINNR